MKEDFLHYVWRFRKFPVTRLQTANRETLTIIHPGQYLQRAGPDFFNAQIVIGNQKWAGNIEMHVKSSDWYLHHHENDPAYESVILHVVWENDTAVFRKDNSEIPVLVLKEVIPTEIINSYYSLTAQKSWVNCEKQLASVDGFVVKKWLERLFFERLERKSKPIAEMLRQTKSDWEAVLFWSLAKNFGLNTNGSIFLEIAKAIPFSVICKERLEYENLEALFFRMASLLDSEKEDSYFADLQFRSNYLFHKYQLKEEIKELVQFFKHRPDNFPTIRLSQLAQLYHIRQYLFTEIMAADSVKPIYGIFNVGVSQYWETHYLFDRESPKKKKMLSKPFIDLIISNTIIPLRFEFAKSQGKEIPEILFSILESIPAEKNAVVEKFGYFGIKAANAFESQALLQLKTEYCSRSRCLECAIGTTLLK